MDMKQRRLQALLTVQAGANMNWSMTSLVAMAGGEVDACGITFCDKSRSRSFRAVEPVASKTSTARHAAAVPCPPVGSLAANR